jgi:hypothetical protein
MHSLRAPLGPDKSWNSESEAQVSSPFLFSQGSTAELPWLRIQVHFLSVCLLHKPTSATSQPSSDSAKDGKNSTPHVTKGKGACYPSDHWSSLILGLGWHRVLLDLGLQSRGNALYLWRDWTRSSETAPEPRPQTTKALSIHHIGPCLQGPHQPGTDLGLIWREAMGKSRPVPIGAGLNRRSEPCCSHTRILEETYPGRATHSFLPSLSQFKPFFSNNVPKK